MNRFSAKIMLLTQDKSDDDSISALRSLCITFPRDTMRCAPGLCKEMSILQVVIDHLVPDGVCDYQAINGTLERLSDSKAGAALLVYPVGRSIVKRAKEARDRLQMMNASLGALRDVAETDPALWTPDLVVSAKALVGQLREQRVQVTDVVPESVLSGVREFVLCEFVSYYFEKGNAAEENTVIVGLASALSYAADLFGLWECFVDTAELFGDIAKEAVLLNKFTIPVEEMEEEDARELVCAIHEHKKGCRLQVAIARVCGKERADFVQKVWEAFATSDRALAAHKVCKAGTAPLEAAAKDTVKNVFDGAFSLAGGTDTLKRLQTFDLSSFDIPGKLAALRSLPNHEALCYELQFVYLGGHMLKAYADMRLWWTSSKQKSERKITKDPVSAVSDLRSRAKAFGELWALPQVGAGGLFQPPNVKDQLNNSAKATLGVLMDASKVNETIKAVQELASGIIAEWVASASELAELVISWTINTWEATCDDMLDDENQELVKSMLENTDFTRCGRGATVLNDWRVLLRTIHGDGCGGVYTSEECKCWQTAVRNASAYCEMTAALHEILNIIPAIVNRNHRKAAARSFKGSCKIRLGKTLSEALESLLATGDQVPLHAKHPAKRSLATDEAVEDVEEPNEKRTKVESAV